MEQNAKKSKWNWLFRFIKWLVWLFYPKTEVIGTENLPQEPCIIVGNHTQMNGPIVSQIYLPGAPYTWCVGEMMHLKEVPSYAYRDFWSQKPKWIRWFYHILAYIITPFSVVVFNNANTVPVYHDSRLITTFRDSIAKLQEGKNLVIFPEKDEKYNNIVYQFQDKFVDTARFYYKKTKQELEFVPMYIAPKLHKVFLGKPIRFNASAPIAEERDRVCHALMQGITDLASELPLHTVVPYRNIPKKLYPKNIPVEVYTNETTGS